MAISWYNVAICIDRNRYSIEKYAYSGIFLRTNIPAGDCHVAAFRRLLAMTVVEVSWSHQVGNSGIGHGRRGHNPALQSYTERSDKLKFVGLLLFCGGPVFIRERGLFHGRQSCIIKLRLGTVPGKPKRNLRLCIT